VLVLAASEVALTGASIDTADGKGRPSTVSLPAQQAPTMKCAQCLSAQPQLAPTDQPRIRDGMVEGATRAGCDPRRAVAQARSSHTL
jgi:hypothetical protein